MYDNLITLLKEQTEGRDEVGNPITNEVKRELFAEIKSIGQSEFYQAAISGHRPEAKFIIADYLDYQGEGILEYAEYGGARAQRYRVIRTYRTGNELEIICRKELGV